jgi:hypothetical protein
VLLGEGRLEGSSGGCHREELLSLLVNGSLPLHRVLSEQSGTFSNTLLALRGFTERNRKCFTSVVILLLTARTTGSE